MRRAVGVYERLVKRFTAQTTDYQRLLSTFAEGLYTEMDFRCRGRGRRARGRARVWVWIWVWLEGAPRLVGWAAQGRLRAWQARLLGGKTSSIQTMPAMHVACPMSGASPLPPLPPQPPNPPRCTPDQQQCRNEALNAQRMSQLLEESEFAAADIVIPQPLLELTTRRVLTMEWVTGVKLTTLQPSEIRTLVKVYSS